MPLYYPKLTMFEEGCRPIMYEGQPIIVVSPDGSIRSSTDSVPIMMYETKCRPPKDMLLPIYYAIPRYYVTQLLCEMKAYECTKLLFTCWSRDTTVGIEVIFSKETWDHAWDELLITYDQKKLKRPGKVRASLASLRTEVKEFPEVSCQFLGEFSSIKYLTDHDIRENVNELSKMDTVLRDMQTLKRWFKRSYELTRREATEILVYMISDLDRKFHMEVENSFPIAYAMKGPSLSSDAFREMTEHVMKECQSRYGITIGVTTADGQWHRFGIRDKNDNPLTKYQLQRDVYAYVRRKPKAS